MTPASAVGDITIDRDEHLAETSLPGAGELFLYRRSYGSVDNEILLNGLRRAHLRTIRM